MGLWDVYPLSDTESLLLYVYILGLHRRLNNILLTTHTYNLQSVKCKYVLFWGCTQFVDFDRYIDLYNHHPNHDREHFHYAQHSLNPFAVNPPTPGLSKHRPPLSLQIRSAYSRSSCKWNQTVCTCFYLAYFFQILFFFYRLIQVIASISDFSF